MTGCSHRSGFPLPDGGPVDLLVVAGEHSGDEHAARMVAGLLGRQARAPDRGPRRPPPRRGGRPAPPRPHGLSVVGLGEVVRNFSFFRALIEETVRWIGRAPPEGRLLCGQFGREPPDRGGAARARPERQGRRERQDPLLHQPADLGLEAGPALRHGPQPRRPGRHLPLRGRVLRRHGPRRWSSSAIRSWRRTTRRRWRTTPPARCCSLPGSRVKAVAPIFPALLAGFAELSRSGSERNAVVLYPERGDSRRSLSRVWGCRRQVAPPEDRRPVAASAVLTSSGTMSMHCALAGIPGAIAYRDGPLHLSGGAAGWCSVPYLGIANILLGEPMYPEFIQGAATPASLAGALRMRRRPLRRRAHLRASARAPRGHACAAGRGAHEADWLSRELRLGPGQGDAAWPAPCSADTRSRRVRQRLRTLLQSPSALSREHGPAPGDVGLARGRGSAPRSSPGRPGCRGRRSAGRPPTPRRRGAGRGR